MTFTASYTWSKSLDDQSDAYCEDHTARLVRLSRPWGPSEYNVPQIVRIQRRLPVAVRNEARCSCRHANKFVQESIRRLADCRHPFHALRIAQFWVLAGADVANTDWGFEPAQRGTQNPYQPERRRRERFQDIWLAAPTTVHVAACPARPLSYAFAQPLPYTHRATRNGTTWWGRTTKTSISLSRRISRSGSPSTSSSGLSSSTLFNHTNYGGSWQLTLLESLDIWRDYGRQRECAHHPALGKDQLLKFQHSIS